MRKLIIILILLNTKCFCQTANWLTGDERSISIYEVQDSVNQWVTLAQIPKGQSSYTYPLSIFPAWYRVKAIGDSNFFTQAIYVSAINSVTITYPIFKPTSLSWTTSGEKNVSYYLIEKIRVSDKVLSQVTKYAAKGSGYYKYYMKKTIYTYNYFITPYFKDLSKGVTLTFQ